MTPDELRGNNWLLAYEAAIESWLPSIGTVDHISTDPFFDSLRSGGVSFYDQTKLFLYVSKAETLPFVEGYT